MALNLAAVGEELDGGTRLWDSKDALLYALGVGAGAEDPLAELEFTTENSEGVPQKVLPTFGIMLASRESRPKLGDFHLSQVLHAEQSIELFGALPVAGTARTTATITAFHDKGKDALAVVRSTITDVDTGKVLAVSTGTTFVRGEGGFGGERGGSAPWEEPDRAPDHTASYATKVDQALLYRLSGDRNPLHADPEFAARAGFDRPILHGLCTYGFTGRALLHALCGGDPDLFGSMSARFTKPVLPGRRLDVQIWDDGATARFRTRAGDATVLDRGVFTRR